MLVPNSFGKDGPVLVSILNTPISSIQDNSPTHSPLPSLSYNLISPSSTPESKKPTVEIEETNDVDSNIEMQLPSPQQPLQPSLQTLQKGSELRRFKYQT